jgi:hypothetical protein
MSQKEKYTSSEWILLLRSLLETPTVMMLASPGGIMGETVALYQAINEALTTHQEVPLVQELLQNLVQMSKEEQAEVQSATNGIRPYEEVRSSYLSLLRQSRFIVAEKATPDEGTAYKQVIVHLAERIANASKEGGFLGFGGTRYTENEQALVAAIQETLGV